MQVVRKIAQTKLLGGAIEAPPIAGALGGPIVVTPGPKAICNPGNGSRCGSRIGGRVRIKTAVTSRGLVCRGWRSDRC